MSRISEKKCPICHAISDTDIFLTEFAYVREYAATTDIENAKKYIRYFPPENLIGSTGDYVVIYQCPCCKTMFDEHTNSDKKTWEIRCQEVIDGYDWWDPKNGK